MVCQVYLCPYNYLAANVPAVGTYPLVITAVIGGQTVTGYHRTTVANLSI